MKITDEIKNKQFDTILDSHLWSKSNEYMALATLKLYFGDRFKDMYAKDDPDLQDLTNMCGIEVTQAIGQNNAKVIGEFCKMREEDDDKSIAKRINKVSQYVDDITRSTITWFPRGIEDEKRDLLNAFNSKLLKIKKYKRKGFNKLSLFIYIEEPLMSKNGDYYFKLFFEKQNESIDKFESVF